MTLFCGGVSGEVEVGGLVGVVDGGFGGLVAVDLEAEAAAGGAAGDGVGSRDGEDVEAVVPDGGDPASGWADEGLDAGAGRVAAGAVVVVDLAGDPGVGPGGAVGVGGGEVDVEPGRVPGSGPGQGGGGPELGRWNAWYEEAIPLADDLFDEYLAETGQA